MLVVAEEEPEETIDQRVDAEDPSEETQRSVITRNAKQQIF
jgi:hypothetical protein